MPIKHQKRAEGYGARVQHTPKGVSMTDQEFKNSSDINNIIKAPVTPPEFEQSYGDLSKMPDLETAFKITQDAITAFEMLPSNVRKLIDNDPSKLVSFIEDEKNKDFLIKEGVLKKPKADPVATGPQPSADKTIPPEGSPKRTDKLSTNG